MSAFNETEKRVGEKNRETRRAQAEKAQAVAEKDDAELRARRDRIGRDLAVAVSLLISVVGAYFGITSSNDTASLAASGQVAGARATSLAGLRGDPADPCNPDGTAQVGPAEREPTLLCANAALISAGLAPISDPGGNANSYQVSIAISRALGRLDALSDLRARGAALPGVTLPGPTGRFPRPDR